MRRLGRNAKWLLVTEPGWSIPFPWVFFYQPVYVVAVGLSEVEYGVWSSAVRGASILFPLIAVPVAVRFGFKRSFLVFDAFSNVAFLSAMMVGRREFVILGMLSNSLLSISAVLWEILLIEGTDPEALVMAYAVPSVIYTVGNSLTVVAGLIMERYGVVEGYRVLLSIALATYLAKTTVLAFELEEPRVDPMRGRESLRHAVRMLYADKRLLILVLYNVLSSIIFAVFGYLSLYLYDQRGAKLSVEAASLIPSLSSAVSLATLAAVSLRPPPSRGTYLALAAVAGSAAYALYALSPAEPRLAFAAALLSGVRGAEFSVARAYFLDFLAGVNASVRGQAISLLYTLSNIISIPAPAAVGLLYSLHPTCIWLLAMASSLAQLALLTALARMREKSCP